MINRGLSSNIAIAIFAVAMSACESDDPARHVTSARKSLDNADYGVAVVELKKALKAAPDRADARFLLARALLESGSPRDAETEARKALELNYATDDGLPLLLRALLLDGEYKKVVAEPDLPLTRPAARAEVETLRGLAHLALRDANSTRAALALALAADPSYTPAKTAQVRLAMAENDLPGALELASRIPVDTPTAIEVLVLKAELESALGRREDAIRTLERAVEIKSDDVMVRSALIVALAKSGRVADADRRLRELKKAAPNHPRTWYSEAALGYYHGNLWAAQTAVERARHFDPDYVPALYLSGLIDMQLGLYASAEVTLRAVVAKSPEDEDARRSLATIFVRRGSASQALSTLEPLLRRAPNDPSLLRTIAEIYLASNDIEKATEYFAKADRLDSGSVAGRVRIAQAKLANGDTAQAIKDLEALAASGQATTAPDVALIDAYVQLRDWDKALSAAARLEKKQPASAATYDAKGVVYMARDDRTSARASFDKAMSLDPDYVPSALNLGKLDVLERNYDSARKRYEHVLEKEPQSEPALLALADLLIQTKAPPDDVTATIRRALAAKPNSVRAWLSLIAYNEQRQDWKAASEAVQNAQWWLPDDPQILEALATEQIRSGETNQAMESLQRAARMQPRSAAPLVRLAQLQTKTKDYDRALESLHAAIERRPDLPDTWVALVDAYFIANRTQAGIDSARRLQTQHAERAAGFAIEGEMYARQQKWAEAASAFRASLARQATPFVVQRLHATLTASGKTDEADAVALQWIKGHPDDITVRTYLAERFMARQDYRAAATQLSAALKHAPGNIPLLNNLARSLDALGDPAAVDYAARAYANAPTNADVADTYGRALLAQGDAARAVEVLRHAVDLAPGDADKRMRLARALLIAGNHKAGRTELEVLAKVDGAPAVRAEAEKLLKAQ